MSKEGEQYYNSFVQQLKDYRDMSDMEFYEEYLDTKFNDEVLKAFDESKSEDEDEEEDYDEFKRTYFEDNVGDITDQKREFFDPLDHETYKSESENYEIHEIALGLGGPNIYLTINTRWNSYEYEFYWGGESYKNSLPGHLEDTINELFTNN